MVTTESGHSDFGALESDLGAGRSDRMLYYAFDILHIGSKSLAGLLAGGSQGGPRRTAGGPRGPIRFSDHIDGGGAELFKRACKLGLEGLVSKRLDASYRSGRTINWTKVTCRNRETFYAVGIANKGKKFDGVYLARRDGGELLYAGKVERGFTDVLEKDLDKSGLRRSRQETQPLTSKSKKAQGNLVQAARAGRRRVPRTNRDTKAHAIPLTRECVRTSILGDCRAPGR